MKKKFFLQKSFLAREISYCFQEQKLMNLFLIHSFLLRAIGWFEEIEI